MHYSVLLNQSVELLAIKPSGVYVDGTFGRGGHSREILNRLDANGKLFAFDKDPEAIAYANSQLADPRLNVIHASFANLAQELAQRGVKVVDGVLLDLGVSSPQLDTPQRGFSFRFAAPLDMRMNNFAGVSAAEWLAQVEEAELAQVLWRYGEEKFARRIARAIVRERIQAPITTTNQLANLVASVVPYKEKGQHPATRVFQAIRIQVNNELGDLEQVLATVPQHLTQGGRMVVISFHSLEDRLVKNKFAQLAAGEQLPKWVLATPKASEFKVIAKKIRADQAEVDENSRSRSAVLRGLERVSVKSH